MIRLGCETNTICIRILSLRGIGCLYEQSNAYRSFSSEILIIPTLDTQQDGGVRFYPEGGHHTTDVRSTLSVYFDEGNETGRKPLFRLCQQKLQLSTATHRQRRCLRIISNCHLGVRTVFPLFTYNCLLLLLLLRKRRGETLPWSGGVIDWCCGRSIKTRQEEKKKKKPRYKGKQSGYGDDGRYEIDGCFGDGAQQS